MKEEERAGVGGARMKVLPLQYPFEVEELGAAWRFMVSW